MAPPTSAPSYDDARLPSCVSLGADQRVFFAVAFSDDKQLINRLTQCYNMYASLASGIMYFTRHARIVTSTLNDQNTTCRTLQMSYTLYLSNTFVTV